MAQEEEDSEDDEQEQQIDQNEIPPVGIPKEVIPAMRKAFSNLCTSQSGVLFENALLQVGVKHEYVGAQGRISVFFGNVSEKSAKTPLHHFRVMVDEVEHL